MNRLRPRLLLVPLNLLVASVVVAAAATAAASFGGAVHSVQSRPGAFAAFLATTLVFQVLAVDVYGRGAVSVAGVGVLATGFTFGIGAGIAAAVAIGLVHAAVKRPKPYRALFNLGTFALSAAAAIGVFHTLGGGGSAGAGPLGLACLAGGIFAAANLGLVIGAMSLAERLSFAAVWRERFSWLTPHYLVFGPLAYALTVAYAQLGLLGLLAFALPPAMLLLSQRQYLNRTREAVDEIRETNAELETANASLRALAENVRKTHRDTIAALSRSMEAKDHYTGGHTERVAALSLALAQRLGYEGDNLEAVEIGALLHDIGKIAIPECILHKPAPLNDEEWLVMKEHPVISEQILSAVELHPFVCQIARWSHERIDGAGYPDGLTGDEIPEPAKIVLVADAFDALTTDRPYRAGRPALAALREIRRCTGTQFCPRVVEALERVYREEPELLAPDPSVLLSEAA